LPCYSKHELGGLVKTFGEVFGKRKEQDLCWLKIIEQEELFAGAMSDPEGNAIQLFLYARGIRMRFWKSEEFFGKAVEERYHREVLKGEELKKTRPIGGAEVQIAWGKKVEENQLRVAGFKNRIAELKEYIRMELAADYGDELPMTFDKYAGTGRLQWPDGKPLTKKKVLEMEKIGKNIRVWPYLFVSLSEKMNLFENTEELSMIPRILEIAAEDMEKPIEELVEDEKYIADLAKLLLNNDKEGLRDWIDGYRKIRELEGKSRVRNDKKKKEKMISDSGTNRELLKVFTLYGYLQAGTTVLIEPACMNAIDKDPILVKALGAILKMYVKKGIPTKLPSGGPDSDAETFVIAESKVPELQEKIKEFRKEYRLTRADHPEW
jgi:hypothetical protein